MPDGLFMRLGKLSCGVAWLSLTCMPYTPFAIDATAIEAVAVAFNELIKKGRHSLLPRTGSLIDQVSSILRLLPDEAEGPSFKLQDILAD